MTAALHILQHALGVDRYGRGRQSRNHYVTGPQCDAFDACRRLADAGLMSERAGSAISGGMPVFVVTEAGRRFVAERSPTPPKLSPGQKRYRRFLAHDCGMTFGQWLKAARQ